MQGSATGLLVGDLHKLASVPSYVSRTADEILYNARIHPEQRCNTLSSEQLAALHHQTRSVCETAVAVNADDSKFPEHWLFKHRWVSL